MLSLVPLASLTIGAFAVTSGAWADMAQPNPCPAQVADEELAVQAAILCGGDVPISGLTTETDSATATAAGTVRWDHNYRPVRMREDNAWIPVDTTLASTADGRITPKATLAETSFSGGGNDSMVMVGKGTSVIGLDAPVATLPKPSLSGNTATYPNVLPGVDLQLIADVDGFSQLLVVHTLAAARNPRLKKLTFAIAGRGMRLSTDRDGNLRATDTNGVVSLTGNGPTMWDETYHQALTGHPMAGAGRIKRMAASVGGGAITLTPDAGMLGGSDTQFPLYIDPSLTLNRTAWSVVDTNLPDTAYWNSNQSAQMGTLNSGTTKRRSYFTFDLGGTAVAGTYVTAATLNLTETYSGSCTARPFSLYSTGPISSATTWNNQPALGALQSSATVAKGYSSSCPSGAVAMDATAAVRTAASSAGTVTLGLRAASETDNSYYKVFANNPTLSITYAPYGNVPGVASATYPRETWAGSAGTSGTFKLTPAPGQTAAKYLYGLNTNPPTTQVTAGADDTATVSMSLSTTGVQRLYVSSIDDAGVPSTVASYVFGVGRGAEDLGSRPAHTMTTAETTALSTLEPMAVKFLQNRAAAITGGQSPGAVPSWVGMTVQESAAITQLQQTRSDLAADGLTYATSAVTVTGGMVQITGNQALYWTTENSTLTPPAGSAEPANAYSIDRVFAFASDGSSWRLTDQAAVDAGPIPPVTEPISQYNGSLTSTVTVDPATSTDDALYDGPPGVNAQSVETLPKEDPATVDGADPVPTDTKVDDPSAALDENGNPVSTGGTVSTQSIPTGLCYSCMVDYATKWAKSYNPKYRNWGKKSEDCTNFVSQALRAGGWKDDTGWYKSSSNWWYNSWNQTWSWTSAEYWSRFATKRTTHLDNVWKMRLGDVLQADWDANGTMDHTMIVTKVTSNEIYLSYHSNPQLNKPLSQILREMWTAHPKTVYYAYGT